MSWIRRFVLLLAALGWFDGTVSADSGRRVGRVVDQTGGPLAGVTVELVTPAGEAVAISDTTGAFRFDGVARGPADLTFRLINFTVQRRSVTVDGDQTSTGDVVMPLSLRADVVVTGTATFRNIADIASPGESLVGIASAASQGAITAAASRTAAWVVFSIVTSRAPSARSFATIG